MISRVSTWLRERLFPSQVRLQLDTKSSESGLAELLGQELGKEELAAMAAVIAGIERGVPEKELRSIHGNELYGKASARYRHQKRITALITEIGNECERQTRREGGLLRQDTRNGVLEQARAAAAFAAVGPLTGSKDKALARDGLWPWNTDEFRSYDSRRNLIVAGAHIVTAIERLDRVAARQAATTAPERREPEEHRSEAADAGGPPPLLFVRNKGVQSEHLLNGLGWLIYQRAAVLHIVANSPENLFDVFKKIANVPRFEPIAAMLLDLAHGAHIQGQDGEIQPIVASQHMDPIDPQAPMLLLYPSLETLEQMGELHARDQAPWFVIPWDWEELGDWLEDHDAEELVFDQV